MPTYVPFVCHVLKDIFKYHKVKVGVSFQMPLLGNVLRLVPALEWRARPVVVQLLF